MRAHLFSAILFFSGSLALSQESCPALDSLLASPRQTEELRLAALECAPQSFVQMVKPTAKVTLRALELDCRNISAVKSPDKKMLGLAVQRAKDSLHCVAPLQASLGEKNKQWISLRKELVSLQPQALYNIYGWKGLTAPERKSLFMGSQPLAVEACATLWDSVGIPGLFPKNWTTAPFAFDSVASACKDALEPRMTELLEKNMGGDTLRARLLAWYPSQWQKRYGEEATDAEKTRYVTHPALRDSSHCRYADWATPDLLMSFGVAENPCTPYINERFGDALFILQFRKNYKPAVLAQILDRMGKLTPEKLEESKPFLDTLGRLLGSVESWEVIDTLEARTLLLFAQNPAALRYFKEPTAPMILAAANADVRTLCQYPVTDRMLSKMLMDRVQDEKPLPTAEEQQALQQCLAPELWNVMGKMLEQLATP